MMLKVQISLFHRGRGVFIDHLAQDIQHTRPLLIAAGYIDKPGALDQAANHLGV
jgi:hypothetical protein